MKLTADFLRKMEEVRKKVWMEIFQNTEHGW